MRDIEDNVRTTSRNNVHDNVRKNDYINVQSIWNNVGDNINHNLKTPSKSQLKQLL